MEHEDIVSAGDVFCGIIRIRQQLQQFINEVSLSDPRLNEFSIYENEMKRLHRGIVLLAAAINAPIDPLVELGLRMSEGSWRNPSPPSASAGLEEVRNILGTLHRFLNEDNGNENVPDYYTVTTDSLENPVCQNASTQIEQEQALNNENDIEEESEFPPLGYEEVNGGASPEEINSMPAHIAPEDIEGCICDICNEEIVAGEEMKILPCFHSVHKACIDEWLTVARFCPIDRSDLF